MTKYFVLRKNIFLHIYFSHFPGPDPPRVDAAAGPRGGDRAGEGRVRVRGEGDAAPGLHLGRLGGQGRPGQGGVREGVDS